MHYCNVHFCNMHDSYVQILSSPIHEATFSHSPEMTFMANLAKQSVQITRSPTESCVGMTQVYKHIEILDKYNQ